MIAAVPTVRLLLRTIDSCTTISKRQVCGVRGLALGPMGNLNWKSYESGYGCQDVLILIWLGTPLDSDSLTASRPPY